MVVEYLQTLEVCKPKLFSEVFFFLKECFEKLFTNVTERPQQGSVSDLDKKLIVHNYF